MTEQKDNVISINGKDYKSEDLNDQQKLCIMQLNDLNPKVTAAKMQLDQLTVSRDYFMHNLINSLETPEEEEAS
tara:strand:- start:1043 stop:1264 length:222 start_codon:yes stop_codon:yes gene_type:complete